MIKVTTANEGGTLALGLDPYEVLGVDRGAAKAQIARARRRLSREYHPDVNSDPGAAARFVEIQRAFELLSDPVARAAYDRAAGILIEPSSVNFGVLESGQPGVGAEVTVSWTGAPPGRIRSDSDGDWWTNMRAAMPDPSCVVFFLQAQAVAGTPNGRRDDRFTVTLDDLTLVVDLTAEIRGVPPAPPPPTFETARRVPPARRPAAGSPGCALAFGLAAVLLLILMFVLFSGSGDGGGGGDTASATPPVRPVRVPQAPAAAIAVRPVFTASEYAANEPDALAEGLAGPPVQRGSEILLPDLPLPYSEFDFPPSFFCVAVTVPDTGSNGAEGVTFVESPVATVAVGEAKDLAYPAILPGAYVLDPNCTPSLSETETFPLGSVTVPNLGVVDAAGTGFDNAMVIFAAHTSGAATAVTYGAIGGVDDLSLIPPADDACIDSDSTTSQATYWQPVRALVSQQITGKQEWFSTGTLVFHGTRANSPQGTFFYDCAEANAENSSLFDLWGIPVP
jgi:hypothetical protein